MSDLGFFEQAWSSALIKTNSTNFKNSGEIGDMEDVRTFSQYLKELESFGTKVDLDKRMDDKLKKYLVMTVDDKDHRSDENVGKVNLLTDEKGYDIAMIYIKNENIVVEVSPEVLKNNNAFLGKATISNDGTKKEVEDFNELTKIMEPNSVKKIVEQIEKYDSIKIRSRDDARNRIKGLSEEEKEKVDVAGDLKNSNDDKESKSEEELEKEAEESNLGVTSDLDLIVKICKENDLNPSDIKQTLSVVDPATIENTDENKTNVDPNGGMVLMLRLKNKEAGVGPDNVYVIQNGKLLPSNSIDNDKMSEIMKQNEGNNEVHELDDDRVEKVLEEIVETRLEYEQQIDTINSSNAENKEEMLGKASEIAKDKIDDCLEKYNNPKIVGNKEIKDKANDEIKDKGQSKAKAEEHTLPELREEHTLPELREEHILGENNKNHY
jgi:hypothetical protein